ncbi:MAG TPA: hypothetical protein VI793_04565 [Anaerolineales bacterium]|nr:hypothetical protein [Anaerolineales bacterium]
MVLTEDVWRESLDLGLLDGDETCALCHERPVILLDVARKPTLLCETHVHTVVEQLLNDLKDVEREASGGGRANSPHAPHHTPNIL